MNPSLRMVPCLVRAVRSLSPPLRQHSRPPIPSVGSASRYFSSSTTFLNSSVPSKDPDAQLLKDLSKLTENDGSGMGSVKTVGTKKRLPEFSMDGKVVTITGGVGGLGIHMAEAILEAGAKAVIALDQLSESKLSKEFYKLADRAGKEFGGAHFGYRRMDVTSEDDVHSTIDDIVAKHGRIDGMIAAAGINKEVPALQHSAKDFNRILDINVTGCFLSAQAVAKHMVKDGKGGSIALIASMSGTIANKDLICPAYNASKAAVVQLGRNLAMEWGPHKIRVNTISPGYILTPMVHVLMEDHPHRKENWPKDNMLGRLSTPNEYRGAAVFLLSDASSFMTGSDLLIDGGHHAW